MTGQHILIALLVVLCFSGINATVSCLDESGSPVDWWIIFKVPHLETSSDPNAQSGYGYAYADPSKSFALTSKRLDQNLSGALGSTLGQIYSAASSQSDSVGWLMYDDEWPDGSEKTSNGHTKGELVFDSDSGYYLLHSIPRFPVPSTETYSFPADEKTYGQSLLCMTYSANSINQIAGGFLINKPAVFDSSLSSKLSGLYPNVSSVIAKNWIEDPAAQEIEVSTVKGQNFVIFAKNTKWGESHGDIYEYLVSPYLQDGLMLDTWQDGAFDNKMPTFCTPEYPYSNINITTVGFTSDVQWATTKDHSKWGIGLTTQWLCIGDLNRQFSQAKRGGGVACTQHALMYTALKKFIVKSDSC